MMEQNATERTLTALDRACWSESGDVFREAMTVVATMAAHLPEVTRRALQGRLVSRLRDDGVAPDRKRTLVNLLRDALPDVDVSAFMAGVSPATEASLDVRRAMLHAGAVVDEAVIIAALNDDDDDLAIAAADVLVHQFVDGISKRGHCLSVVIQALSCATGAPRRRGLARALSRAAPDVIGVLNELSLDADVEMRIIATHALVDADVASDALVESWLSDDDMRVRMLGWRAVELGALVIDDLASRAEVEGCARVKRAAHDVIVRRTAHAT